MKLHRRRLIVKLTALSVAAFSFSVPPGGAFHNPDIPLVETIAFAGNAHAALRLFVPDGGGAFSIEVQGTRGDDGYLTAVGSWGLTPDGSLQFASVVNIYTDIEDRTHVGVPPAGTIISLAGQGNEGNVAFATTRNLPPGEHVHLLMVGTDSSSLDAEFNVYASDGIEYDLTLGGAWLVREQDFDGQSVVVKSAAAGEPVWVKAIDGATWDIDVQGRMYGLFKGLSNTRELEMSLAGPAGTEAPHCVGSDFCIVGLFTHGGPPGVYTYGIDHSRDYYGPQCSLVTSTSRCTQPIIYGLGADVQLP